MPAIQSVFRRYEKKYLISKAQFEKLSPLLCEHFSQDQYGNCTIYNIYFDTPDHLLIRRSLEKPVYKEKLRLRSYCIPKENDTVFVELKKKYNGIVYKRRIPMSYHDAYAHLYRHETADSPSQIMKEIDWTFDFYGTLCPQMYLSYKRQAFFANDDKNLRLTFDSDILFREHHLTLDEDDFADRDDSLACMRLQLSGDYLMELKVANAMPLWLTHALNELEIYPISVSKYGAAYMQTHQTDAPLHTPVPEHSAYRIRSRHERAGSSQTAAI